MQHPHADPPLDRSPHGKTAQRLLAATNEIPFAYDALPKSMAGGNGPQHVKTVDRFRNEGSQLLEPLPRNGPASSHVEYHDPETTCGFLQSTVHSFSRPGYAAVGPLKSRIP